MDSELPRYNDLYPQETKKDLSNIVDKVCCVICILGFMILVYFAFKH